MLHGSDHVFSVGGDGVYCLLVMIVVLVMLLV